MKKILSFCLMMLVAIQVAFAEGKTTPSTSDSGNLNVETGGGNNKATDETQTRDGGSNSGDKKIITSQKYVDDELAKKQNKIGTQSGTYAVTYTNTAGTVTPRQVKTSLGTNTSDSALPTVSAVNAGLNLKQTKVPAKDVNTVVTYTGTEGVIGEKGIYQDDATYAGQMDNLIEAGAFNAAVKTGLDSEFLCAGNSSGGDCWLWSIHNETDPELPPEYRRLEYIQGDKTAYINTQFTPNNNTSVEAKFQFPNTETGSSGNFIMGSRASMTSRAFTLVGFSGGTAWASNYGTSGGSFGTPDTNVHVMKRDKDKVYLDGELRLTTSVADFTAPGPAYVFSTNQNGSPYLTSNIKLWYLKIWDNGTLVRDYVPCIRVADGVAGLYDVVNNIFYGNIANSGNFTASSINVPYTTLVPDGYTPVEYITFDGTASTGAYINTGLSFYTNVPNNKIRIVADAKLYQGSNWQVIAGNLGSATAYVGANGSNKIYYSAGGGDVNTNVSNPYTRSVFDLNLPSGTYRVVNASTNATIVNIANITPVARTTAYPILIGAYGQSGAVSSARAHMDLYGIKIYNDGALVFSGIPAKYGDVIGLYDTVSGTFKTNAGSGTFTAGPDISNIVYIPQGD